MAKVGPRFRLPRKPKVEVIDICNVCYGMYDDTNYQSLSAGVGGVDARLNHLGEIFASVDPKYYPPFAWGDSIVVAKKPSTKRVKWVEEVVDPYDEGVRHTAIVSPKPGYYKVIVKYHELYED